MPRHEELARPRLDAGAQGRNLLFVLALLEHLEEVDELLASLALDLEPELQTLVQELTDCAHPGAGEQTTSRRASRFRAAVRTAENSLCSKSASLRPRDVIAGAPMRTPPCAIAETSPWTAFLLSVMCIFSKIFSILEPVSPSGRRSHSIRWFSVPSVASL